MIHIIGVCCVRADNTMIKEKLGWAPSIKLADGLKTTYFWIKEKVEADKAKGVNLDEYKGSVIVKAKVSDDGASVRAGKV